MIIKNIKHLVFLLVLNSVFAQSNLENLSNEEIDAIKEELQESQDLVAKNADNPLELVTINGTESEETNDLTPYFGYDYFEREVNFFDNIPATDQFKLGPGDEIILSLWGETNVRQKFTLNRDGSIFYDNIGFIKLDNKTIKEAESILSSQLATIYSTINNKENSTELLLELGKLRSINVYFSGETKTPGINFIHPFSDIFMALVYAGVKKSGSLRKIQLIREGNIIDTFDFYSFFLDGKDIFSSTRILDGDVIHIPTVSRRVEITGEVVRPAYFEILDNESVLDLIKYSGNQTAEASTKILFDTITPINERSSDDNARKNLIIDLKEAAKIDLNDGDSIQVTPIGEVERNVTVFGRVKFPNQYPASNSTLKDVLDVAGGFNDPIFRKSIRDDDILVLRKDANQYYSLEFNVSYDESDKFKLIPDDQIFVYENSQYTNRFAIEVSGEVNKRGTYQFREKMTVQDVINLADGFTELANKSAIIVSQSFSTIDGNGDEIVIENQINDVELDFQVPNGAKVNVLPLENVVEVQGGVYNPGLIQYKKGYRYPRYIELAGGYKPNSLKRKAYIRRANGNIEKVNGFFISRGKRVYAGDSIIIPENLNPTDFNIQTLLTDALSVLTNLVAILAIIENTSD